MRSRLARPGLAGVVAILAVLVAPHAVTAADDPRDVRRTGSCTRTSEIELRLRADDGVIRVEVEVESDRRRSRWSVILIHDRRIAFRGVLRADGGGTMHLRRAVPDWFGVDTLVVRASGPRRESCRVAASVRGR